MKAISIWSDIINIAGNGDNCVYDICFSPDGTQMVVACGLRIIIYDVLKGNIVTSIKDGHKGLVYCLSYSTEGKFFASGSADKTVIVWTEEGQGIVKYSHSEPIQCISYNPTRELLASCSTNDFGFWSQEKKNVNKTKVSSRINVCAWSSDGLYFAIGLSNGTITIRTPQGDEQGRIERPGGSNSAIWGISWATILEEGEEKDILCIADWAQTLSFYNLLGKQVMKERSLGFDPMRIVYVSSHRDCKYVIVVGSNRCAAVYTMDGVRVANLCEQSSWIWTVAVHQNQRSNTTYMALGTGGGLIGYYEIQVLIVHALFKSFYAFRVNMTDVKVQNLEEGVQVVMKCRDLIKKVAISKSALAVQLPDKVLIYQREEETDDFKYRLVELISQKFDCSLLVMCSEHLIICLDKKLQALTLNGTRVKEWYLTSNIRYIRCVGGMKGKEVLLAGLKDGQVVKIFLDNLTPVNLLKVPQSVRCLDLNYTHSKLAVIDDSMTLYVYLLQGIELLYQEPGAITVFWNSQFDDLLSFSSAGQLKIKANGFKMFQQKMPGFVVGFNGKKVFSMHNSQVSTFEVSMKVPVKQYTDANQFDEALLLASLGINKTDLLYLGNQAIKHHQFKTAKNVFRKLNLLEIVGVIKEYEDKIESGEVQAGILLAQVYSLQGKYSEAAKVYREINEEHLAVAMYADLRMFDQAQEFLSTSATSDKMELMKKKAEWATKINEPRAAAEMFLVAGEKLRAIELMEQNGWTDMLLELGQKLEPSESEALTACAEALVKVGQVTAAADLYQKNGATEKVLDMYIASQDWEECFLIAKRHPNLKRKAYLPYAEWLVETDKFAEAQKAFHEAGCPEQAFRVLDLLKKNSITENRFQDASYYDWLLSTQYLDLALAAETDLDRQDALKMFENHRKKAIMYFCFDAIYKYIDFSFTLEMKEDLFNMSRYLMHELLSGFEIQISKFHVFYTLTKQARTLKAFKLARYVIEKLRNLRVPDPLENSLTTLMLQAKADPFDDDPELLPLCYKCSTTNPLLNPRGNRCLNCFHPFIYSFPSFEVLPLIQFQIEEGITDEEAVGLIGSRLPADAARLHSSVSRNSSTRRSKRSNRIDYAGGGDRWKETKNEDTQILQLDYDDEDDHEHGSGSYLDYGLQRSGNFVEDVDPFTSKSTELYDESIGFVPVKVGKDVLRTLEPTEVVICKWPKPLMYTFYKNCIPDTPLVCCQTCWMIYHADDLIQQMLSKGTCPFCRSPLKRNTNK